MIENYYPANEIEHFNISEHLAAFCMCDLKQEITTMMSKIDGYQDKISELAYELGVEDHALRTSVKLLHQFNKWTFKMITRHILSIGNHF